MKQYTKPEVIESTKPDFAFPAIGLALIGGYVAAKAATGITKAVFEINISSESLPAAEAII